MRISDWSSDVCSSDLLQWKLVDLAACVSKADVRCIGVGYVDAGGPACVDVDVRSLSIVAQRSRPVPPPSLVEDYGGCEDQVVVGVVLDEAEPSVARATPGRYSPFATRVLEHGSPAAINEDMLTPQCPDRTSAVSCKSVSVRVHPGVRPIIKKKR